MEKTMITAHSGCEGTLMDSMESVDRAMDLKADAIEMDVRRTEDGFLYVSHDRQSNEAAQEKVSLESVFEKIKDTTLKFNCDIKETMAIPDVLMMGKKYGFGPDRLILTGAVSLDLLANEPGITENAAVYLNLEEMLKFLYLQKLSVDQYRGSFDGLMKKPDPFVQDMELDEACVTALIGMMKALRVRGINMPHRLLNQALTDRIHGEGLECSVFTVNEAEHIDRCLSYGVENITTKTPACALERRCLAAGGQTC